MKQVRACLRLYVAAWWMKLIAAGLALFALGASLLYWPSERLIPAWPTAAIVPWQQIPELVEEALGAKQAQEIRNPVALTDVEGIAFDSFQVIPVDVSAAPRLRHIQLNVSSGAYRGVGNRPDGTPHPQFGSTQEQVASVLRDQLEELLKLPTVEAVEINGMLPTSVLSPLSGNFQVATLLTGGLIIEGDTDAYRAQELELAEIVASMPSLRTWCVPSTGFNLLRSPIAERINAHQSLETLLVRRTTGPFAELAKSSLPAELLRPSHIEANRFYRTLGAISFAVITASLLLMQIAQALALTSSTVLPGYSRAHRITGLIVLALIASGVSIYLIQSSCDAISAILLATIAVLIPAGFLDYDRRSVSAGMVILPACFTPLIGIFVAGSLEGNGQYWVWVETFLSGQAGFTALLGLLAAIVILVSAFALATERYASSLAMNNRVAVLGASQADIDRIMSKASQEPSLQPTLRGSGILPSQALRDGTLSSPATPEGQRRLIAEGMLHASPWHVVFSALVITILLPLFFRYVIFFNNSPALARDPYISWKMAAFLGLIFLWMRPLIQWNERIRRLTQELATLLPRVDYLNAVDSLLKQQLVFPASLAAIGVSVFLLTKVDGWLMIPAVVVAVALARLTTVSIVETAFTLRTSMGKFLFSFLVGYGFFGVFAAIFIAITKSAYLGAYLGLAGIAIVVALFRFFIVRRLYRFEFGKLV